MDGASGASDPWMVYGAYGYTGRIIAELAAEQGMRPLLAGRSSESLRPLASRLGLPSHTLALDDPQALREALRGMKLVLNCAGPFVRTALPMAEACLDSGCDYLDITGEIAVFEALSARGETAAARGVMLLPGVGFDVVPSDCLAAHLAKRVGKPAALELAIRSSTGPSPGTLKTILEGLGSGGFVRRAGRIEPVPIAHARVRARFPRGPGWAYSIPWGDVSTAFHSTGARDITTYMAMPPLQGRALMAAGPLLPALLRPALRTWLQAQVERRVRGPSLEQRQRGRSELWGRMTSASGEVVEAAMQVAESYRFTGYSALECIRRSLAGKRAVGFQTPASAYGSELAHSVPDTVLDTLTP